MFLATRRSAQSQKCRIRYEKCISMHLSLTTYERMQYMGSAWKEGKENGRPCRHFFATGTMPNHRTRHGEGRHMADKGHPRNHEGRRPCSTGTTPVLRVGHFRSEGNCRPRE